MRLSDFTSKQATLLATPPILLVSTHFAFIGLAELLGPKAGYLCGFVFYWALLLLMSGWIWKRGGT